MMLINDLNHVITVDDQAIRGGRRASAEAIALVFAFGKNTTTFSTTYVVSAAGSFSTKS